jgi:CheY-like chemotaxis protein
MTTPKRILVVDDNEDGAVTLGMLLEVLGGHKVEIRYDGAAALELLRTFRPDIIFLDLSMPHIDGYELCARIRREPWSKTTVLLAVTGWMHAESAAIDAGFDGCILKPVALDQLAPFLLKSASHGRPASTENQIAS